MSTPMNANARLPDTIRPHSWLAQAWASAQQHPHWQPYIGRFAPSPSGKLHQGSLIAALASYLHARWHGGRWLVRMEDVDTSRCIRATGEQQLTTLRELGFVFDEPVCWQTERFAAYRAAFEQLRRQKMIYPCTCTRSQISAQQQKLHADAYPKACLNGINARLSIRSWRFCAHDAIITWQDESGEILTQTVDDFVLKRGDEAADEWAYQLAVVVDDAAQGITHVVRGADLIDATARQMVLQRALHLPTPKYAHTPLLLNPNGEKLSKSQQSPALDVLNSTQALLHAWRFLGGVDFECTDAGEFWAKVL